MIEPLLGYAVRYGMALESVLPAHPANGTGINWWRFVGHRGPLFDLGARVHEAAGVSRPLISITEQDS